MNLFALELCHVDYMSQLELKTDGGTVTGTHNSQVTHLYVFVYYMPKVFRHAKGVPAGGCSQHICMVLWLMMGISNHCLLW